MIKGSTGFGAFENDHALDWADDLERAKDPLAFYREDSRQLLEIIGRLAECDCALAAAEVVAALQGNASRHLPDNLKELLADRTEQPAEQFRTMAIEACQKILEDSELKELNGNDALGAKPLSRAWLESKSQPNLAKPPNQPDD